LSIFAPRNKHCGKEKSQAFDTPQTTTLFLRFYQLRRLPKLIPNGVGIGGILQLKGVVALRCMLYHWCPTLLFLSADWQ